ncbi:hypothetical protein M4R22_15340 [Acidovorax sp. GBBC 3334]|uniref:hypothetical protein n=1 Tax=Acidovorax sp. GBBC 3334 TaxID=2940496 RepID=UPI0023022F9D|nr:hypothetical protein [Acidovorax sp. GBBC 3334]MDA8456142.1 hypothetical protein [Acidovorax sp. GBBC 3334]
MTSLLRLLGYLLRGRSGKVIALGAAGLCAGVAVAATCTEWSGDGGKTWQSSTAAACAAMKSSPGYTSASTTVTEKSEGVCKIMDSGMYIRDEQLARRDADCNDKCTAGAGQMSTMNYTRGWARSALPNKADQLGATAEIPKSICAEGCKYGVLGNEEAYRSQVPSAQGLYRLSSDVSVIQTDQACTADASTDAVSPQTPDKPCPGSLGELNGKPYCAPSTGQTGVDPAGSPGKEPDDKGNPTAGKKPTSGEGSGTGGVGRTPTEGSGGNRGGPAGAAFGGSGNKPGDKPTGTVDKPTDGKEQAACGAPGQPKCAIDETGTPKVSPNEYDKSVDQYKTDMDQLREKASGSSDKGYFEGWRSLWFAPPVVACTPFKLPVFLGVDMGALIDPCAVVNGVRYIMAYLWALAGLFICLRMITQTFRAGV